VPEIPDLTVYIECMEKRILGHTLVRSRIKSSFLLRTYDPPAASTEGKKVTGVCRIGKHVVLELENGLYLVFHLMIAGRFLWRNREAKIPARIGLAAFDFSEGTLVLTEAGTKRRASLHIILGEENLAKFDRGGLEVLDADLTSFSRAITRENHTVKRALTDPSIISGIGNTYSDEILHKARLSPFKYTSSLTAEDISGLYCACREILAVWTDIIRRETGTGFPEKVTAFREGMAVHGRFGLPCPVCGAPVQRIVYTENESNYCPGCQTGGKIYADRALSRLLKDDWPKTLGELEEKQLDNISRKKI
jgi:formamidopyrimidine-DNA glycosylase